MANRSSGPFKTPEQPSRVKGRLSDASPNFTNFMHQLPDLTPPRKHYSESFGSLNPAGSSPQQVGFGFARLPASSPERLQNGDNKSDGPGYDTGDLNLLGLRATPMKSTITTELSPRSFSLAAPPMPIFHPSPRRPSDASYLSPDAATRQTRRHQHHHSMHHAGGSHHEFGFSLSSPRGIASPNMGQITSNFAAILDGHSRTSPLSIKAVMAGATAIMAGANGDGTPRVLRSNTTATTTSTAAGDVRTNGTTAAAGGPSNNNNNTSNTSTIVVRKEDPSHRPFAGLFTSSGPNGAKEGKGKSIISGGSGSPDEHHHHHHHHHLHGGGKYSLRSTVDQQLALMPVPLDVGGVPHLMNGEEETDDMYVDDAERADALGPSHEDSPPSATHAVLFRSDEGTTGTASGPSVVLNSHHHGGHSLRRRPERRRALDFSSPVQSKRVVNGSGSGGRRLEGDEGRTQPMHLHAMLPSSPICQPVSMSMDTLLPIARLRDDDGIDMDAVHRSPIQRARHTSNIDSPAVKEAATAAVNAVLQATRAATRERERGNVSPMALGRRKAHLAASTAAATSVGVSRPSGASTGGVDVSSGGLMIAAAAPAAPPGSVKCNCKKSRCLKLYCDCFKIGIFCGATCSCVSCANRADNAATVREARDAIVNRNPLAFSQKIVEAPDTSLGAQHRRGCNCKKSRCLKKYCECFQAGIACGELCKCEACHNTVDAEVDRPQPPPAAAGLVGNKRPRGEDGVGVGGPLGPGQVPMSALQPSFNALSHGSGDIPGTAVLHHHPGNTTPNGTTANGGGTMPALQMLFLQQMKQRAAAAAVVARQQQAQHAQQQGGGGSSNSIGVASPPGASITTSDGQVLVPISWPLAAGKSGTLLALSPSSGAGAGTQAHDTNTGAGVVHGGLALTPVCEPSLGEDQDHQQQHEEEEEEEEAAAADLDTGSFDDSANQEKASVASATANGTATTTTRRSTRGSGSATIVNKPKTSPTKRKPARTVTAALE